MLQLQAGDSEPKRHVLPLDHFRALSEGRGDSEVVRFLWDTQRSRRLLLVTALFDEADERPDLLGDLPPAADARHVLAQAQTTAPAAIDELLLNPQVGAWAAYTMRRHHTGVARTDDTPLWVDLGVLHMLSLVAAWRSGLTWRTRLPHRHGRVLLFGMGMAEFPQISPDRLIDAETSAGRITLTAADATLVLGDGGYADGVEWRDLHRLRTTTNPELVVSLDDIDPFRDLADPVPPQRLDPASVDEWSALLDGAWTILCDHYPDTAEAIAVGVVSLVPLPIGDGRETRSASSGESFGRVMVSPPPDAATLALSLVHEFQHIKLGGLMHLTPLTDDDSATCYYAPWRDDPRPVGGLMQGIYAFFGIAAFWRRYRATVSGTERRLADFEYAYARTQTLEGISVILASGRLTQAGRELVERLSTQLEQWPAPELDPGVRDAARIVADRHRTGWRIRHHQVRGVEVAALAAAYRDGTRAVVTTDPPQVQPAPAVRWSQNTIESVRRSILYPDTWQAYQAPANRQPTEAALGDTALVAGDLEAASERYTAALRDHFKDFDVWSGFTLTVRPDKSPRAAWALRERPELVFAVYAALADTNPDALRIADQVGEVLQGTAV
jgi:HEXXH motif-containing protein